ncbi:MAG: hypothetical protein K2Q18_14750 [Bdellovibrionales bacterium]|nr:hypothetical protein [Bdellovibrionales bacterium]
MLLWFNRLLIVFFSLISIDVLASGAAFSPGKYTVTHNNLKTSNQYRYYSWDYSIELFNGAAIFGTNFIEGHSFQKNFVGKNFFLGHRYNTLYTKPELFLSYFNWENAEKKSNTLSGLVNGVFLAQEKLNVSYQVGYTSMTQELQTNFFDERIIKSVTAIFKGNLLLNTSWRGTFNFKNYFLSDKNTRLNHDLGLMYGIGQGDPWIWLGVGGSRLSNSKMSEGYWSPDELFTIGPRLEVTFSFLQRMNFTTEAFINYLKASDTKSDFGFNTLSKVGLKLNPNLDSYVSFECIQSQQYGGIWRSSGFSLGLSGNW